MKFSVEMSENMALLTLADTGEQYCLLNFPDFEHNYSHHPLRIRQLPEQVSVRDKYIGIIRETFRLYNSGKIISPSLLEALLILSEIFEENMRTGFPLTACCLGENLHPFSELIKDSLLYFEEKSRITIIETNMLPPPPAEKTVCRIQGFLPEIWKLPGNDRFDILIANGNVLLRSRIDPIELLPKVKSGGLIFLYYQEGSIAPNHELADYDKKQIGEAAVYILRATHSLKNNAAMHSADYYAEWEINNFLNTYGRSGDLMQTLSDEAGNSTFSISGLKTLDEFLANFSTLEDWLLQHIDQLENPDIPLYANEVKTAGLDLWLEVKADGRRSETFWNSLNSAYAEFCKEIETEFS